MLEAQRFAGNATLEACVSVGYRMLAGEQDGDAVRRLQCGLDDLGYVVDGGIDGVFGGGTGRTVAQFKTEEDLQPTDPVASVGTISQLDRYYAHERAEPDAPDPSSGGLGELLAESMSTALGWVEEIVALLERIVEPIPDPDLDDPIVAAEHYFLVSRSSYGEPTPGGPPRAFGEFLLPVYRHVRRLLEPATTPFAVEHHDRASYQARFPGQDYVPLLERLGGILLVTPAFRNALDADERAATVLRLAVSSDGRITGFAVPESPRWLAQQGDTGLHNAMAYAAYAFAMATGSPPRLHPRFRWSPVPM